MRWAIVTNGVVRTVTRADAAWLSGNPNAVEVADPHVGPGWLYDGATFSPPAETDQPERPTVAMYQMKLELHQRGRLADVGAAIDALNEPKRTQAQLRWYNAAPVELGDVVSDVVAATLALNRKNLELLFAAAAKN